MATGSNAAQPDATPHQTPHPAPHATTSPREDTAAPRAPVVTRFAPSPTGHLHIGGARSALFCWAYAKARGGRFMIRIEDTDLARSSEESARGILEDLAWLGIAWDDGPTHTFQGHTLGDHSRPVGPYFQAQRASIYNAYVEDLVRRGRAYPAFDTPEETEAQRAAATAAKQTYRYPRPADVIPGQYTPGLADRWARACAGTRHVIRFVVPNEPIVVRDRVLGDVKIAAGELDDFVIRKPDGMPTYHFAVVVDDELMGVTDVLRAQEHLANTPRHVALQRALIRLEADAKGRPFTTPTYAHMPIICNMDGSKMSKRDKAKAARKAVKDALAKDPSFTATLARSLANVSQSDLAAFIAAENDSVDIASAIGAAMKLSLPEIEVWDFRRNGYLPEAICNFVALLGWNPGVKTDDGKDLEKFDMHYLATHFSVERVGKTNSKFDRAKLLSFNADAMAAMGQSALFARWHAWALEHEPDLAARLAVLATQPARLALLMKVITPRAKTLRDLAASAAFALTTAEALAYDAPAVAKHLTNDSARGLGFVREIALRLESLPDHDFTGDRIQPLVEQLAHQNAGPDNKPAMGPVSQALRVALTGGVVSPGIGETMQVLGKAESLARLARCLAHCAP